MRKNLTYTQRLQIEALYNAKLSKQQIAEQIGCSIRTIYYELKRGAYQHKIVRTDFYSGTKIKYVLRYSARIAQDNYNLNMTSKGAPLKIGKDFALVHYIEKRVKQDKISPCAVLGEIKRKQLPYTIISKTTLYRYIRIGIFENITMKDIRSKEKHYQKHVIKKPPKGTSIEKRPSEVNARCSFGHWEMDCVCGPTKPVILNLTERLTRKVILFKMPNQKATSVVHCLNVLERRFGSMFRRVFKTITVDNGCEFSDVNGMEKSSYRGKRTTLYYCHPYCSSERGSNERLNREIRRLVPKGSNLALLSENDVQQVERWVNNYPREVLGYATSEELFTQHIQSLQ